VILAATSWPDVAQGALVALVPLAWAVLAEVKASRQRKAAAAAEEELATERVAHKATKIEVRALTTRKLRRLSEDEPEAE